MKFFPLLFLFSLLPALRADVVEYHLRIAEQGVAPDGRTVPGMTINGGIPGPTLRFREGDTARIHVTNTMRHHTTSLHWHGILLPNEQDGVPEITTPSIQPGSTHIFEFPIRQTGTYWYHSHTHFQEQSGVYGAIVIEPRKGAKQREEVLLFSDWTHLDPHDVHRDLLRGSEWPSVKKNLAQSVFGAWKAGASKDFWSREWSRMKPMDVSDVAYDAFLVNGQPARALTGKPGERIKLRLINGSSSTYFYVTSSTGDLTIVEADGQPVKPVAVPRLLMAVAETYDVMITIPGSGKYELRATAEDGSGHASVSFGEGTPHPAPAPPRPEIYRMDHMLDHALADPEMASSMSTDSRPPPPYELLEAPKSTALRGQAPAREMTMRLTGDMERYLWSFDGKTITEESVVPVRKGEILRITFVNDTMMRHPLHLHGFFFRVLNQHGDRSPLKHTVDVPPMGRRTIEFEANESGDWMFHCHLLYHMMAGMARVVAVRESDSPHAMTPPAHAGSAPHAGETQPSSGHGHSALPSFGPKAAGVRQAEAFGINLGEHAHEMTAFWGEAALLTNMTHGYLNLRNGRNDLRAEWEAGWQGVDDFESSVEARYERWLGPNLTVFGGARFEDRDEERFDGLLGARYRLPGMILATISLDTHADVRAGLSKSLPLTSRLSARADVRYDTEEGWEWGAGLDYLLSRDFSLTLGHHSDYGFGGGIIWRF